MVLHDYYTITEISLHAGDSLPVWYKLLKNYEISPCTLRLSACLVQIANKSGGVVLHNYYTITEISLHAGGSLPVWYKLLKNYEISLHAGGSLPVWYKLLKKLRNFPAWY